MLNNRTVHVVDDNKAARRALGLVLGAAGHAYRLHESAHDFLKMPPDGGAGCIIAAIRLPGMKGREFPKWLKAFGTGPPVIVIAGHGDVPMAVSALKAGAFDFIETPVNTDRLLIAIAAALKFNGKNAGHRASVAKIQGCLNTLSTREREVFDGLLAGRPNKAIGRDLDVSPRTVEVYRADAFPWSPGEDDRSWFGEDDGPVQLIAPEPCA